MLMVWKLGLLTWLFEEKNMSWEPNRKYINFLNHGILASSDQST